MASAETKVRWRGQTNGQFLTTRHEQHILARERILKWGRFATTIFQGSFHTGYPPSAGTHDGGDCADCIHNATALQISRVLGSARFHRTKKQGFSMEHDHEVLDYSAIAAVVARAQLASYHRHRNGLKGDGPDNDYYMHVFPKFIYNGYVGYVRAKKNTYAWEQQTKSVAKLRLNAVATGQITLVVAETEVAGKRWYVTLTGKCLLASEFNKVNYSFKKVAKTYYIKKATALYTQPFSKSKPATTVQKVGTRFNSAGQATVNKNVWMTDKNGRAVPLSRLTTKVPAGVTPPKPVVPEKYTLSIGTRNVIFRRMTPSGTNPPFTNVKKGKSWAARRPLLAQDVKDAQLAVLGTTEAGTYAAGNELAQSIQTATGKKWGDILHGDNAGDITQGILWDETQIERISSGKLHTEGTDHDWVVWAQNRIIKTGVVFYTAVLHCEWKAGGKSAKGNVNDKKRERQFSLGIKAMEKLVGEDAIIIYTGDFNSSLQNPYDGPGKAAKAHGLVDCESVAALQVDTKYDSYHGGGSPQNDSQLDRFFIAKRHLTSGKVKVLKITVRVNPATKAGSDHYQVDIQLEISTKD